MNLIVGKKLDRHLGSPAVLLLRPFFLLGCAARRLRGRSRERGRGSPATIVLIKLWGLGNVVLLTPVVRAIRRRHPGARITFLSFSSNAEALGRIPEIDEVLCLDLTGWLRLLVSTVRSVWRLRRLSPDLLLDFEQFCYLSSLLTFFSSPGRSVGFSVEGSRRGGLYTHPVLYREDRHMAAIFARLAELASVDPWPLSLRPFFLLPEEERLAREAIGDHDGPVVGIHPGSGDNFPGRRWPEGSFAELADRLVSRHGCRVYFTGSPGEKDLVATVRGLMKESSLDFSGSTSLGMLAALQKSSTLFVSSDTGPMHLAAAMGSPVLALFGPNTPRLYGPLSNRAIVLYRGLACSPCISNLNLKESRCRLPLCMLSLSPERVLDVVTRSGFLKREGSARPRTDRPGVEEDRPQGTEPPVPESRWGSP